ncbi:thioesterase family protein [uncultured Enterovirga sp.]|uniref:thioesterase family protein n=1 Tax=uncultured Enterovirga sp. TaxID=2026352 RepID=UPI0035CA806C
MSEGAGPPVFVFAPFVSSTMRVEPGWIDYNGHMNMAYYLVLFDRAIDEALAVAGLGPDYLDSRGCSYFTAEIHTLYRRELSLDDEVRVTMQLIDHDEKRIHAYLEIRQHHEGWVAASCEKLFLHVGMTDRRVCPFPPDILANLGAIKTAHGRLPRPEALGRNVSLRAPRPRDRSPAETSSTHH